LINEVKKITNIEVDQISSRFVNEKHMINFSLKDIVMPYIKDHCLRPIINKNNLVSTIEYDFDSIQNYFINMIFSGKPLIDTELKRIQFSGEYKETGILSRFKSKIKQIEISDENKKIILNNLGSSDRIRKCFKRTELAMNFLQATGSISIKVDEKKLLVEYLENDLLLSDSIKLFGPIGKLIQLQHIDSLLKTLEQSKNNN
jgi:hypothetical protein